LKLPLHVLLNQGVHVISFVAEATELSPGMFSFLQPPTPAQLILRVEEYKYVDITLDGDNASVTLSNPATQEMCIVSDIATRPETFFKRFTDVTTTVQ
jgi:hypothetical protein